MISSAIYGCPLGSPILISPPPEVVANAAMSRSISEASRRLIFCAYFHAERRRRGLDRTDNGRARRKWQDPEGLRRDLLPVRTGLTGSPFSPTLDPVVLQRCRPVAQDR